MPLLIQGSGQVPGDAAQTSRLGGTPDRVVGRADRLEIGLVNNMPDGALRATERQFARMLAAASGDVDVRLHLLALPGVPRDGDARDHIAHHYRATSDLAAVRLDALIVTGAEPRRQSLVHETYWPGLARLIDWAEHNTVSTLWSCLGAHAAVLHLDGIDRVRLPGKCVGLFESLKVSADGVLGDAPSALRVPHSRWNSLDERRLRAHGYRIVSRSPEVGVDTFTKQWGSLFVFLQGHPEYDADSLYREFRRDALRYLAGEIEHAPALPSHYFDQATELRLTRFIAQAAADRRPRMLEAFPSDWAVRPALLEQWRRSAAQLFRGWLRLVAEARR